MSVDQAPNGRWRARWRDGGGTSRSQTFDRKLDAERHERKMRDAVLRGVAVAPGDGQVTVRRWSEQWLAGAMNLGAGGRETYQRDLDRYILPAFGGMQLRRLSTGAIEEFLAVELAAGLATSSVVRHYRTVRRMLQVAVERHMIPRNPCDQVRPPTIEERDMRILNPDDIERLADAMTRTTRAGELGGRYRAWVFVAAYAGLRWSECVGLQRKWVDGARITVVDQLVRRADGDWHRDTPKTKAGRRVVTLPEFVAEELERHIDRFALSGPDGLVFPNQYGRPINGPSFRGNVWTRACGAAGLADRVLNELGNPGVPARWVNAPRPHDLRHTAVSLMILAGAHPKAIQVRMGHASIGVTMDRYGHLFPEMNETVAAELGKLRPGLRLVG